MTYYTLEDVPIGSVIRGCGDTYTVTGHNQNGNVPDDHFNFGWGYLCLRDLNTSRWKVISFGKKPKKEAKGFAQWVQKVEAQ